MINYKVKFRKIFGAISYYDGYIRDKTLANSTTYYIIETDDSDLHIVHPTDIVKILEKI